MSSEPASGLLIVDKPAGWTSHQVVGRVRRLLGTRKVGHAGTLDPMATGVLIIGVNRATRLLGHLALHDKRYLATIRLGVATDTDDAEGQPISQASAAGLREDRIRAAMAELTGTIHQVPSSYSAIKVDGKRAYDLARQGQEVALKARQVEVTRFELGAIRRFDDVLDLSVDVECSSGTYVRALARDLGAALGVGGHLTMLRRLRIGPFSLDDAPEPVDLNADRAPALLSMGQVASRAFTPFQVDDELAQRIRYGQSLRLDLPADPTAMLDPAGELLALYRPEGGAARPVAVFG